MTDKIDALIHAAMSGSFGRGPGDPPRYTKLGRMLDEAGLSDQRLRFNEALNQGRLVVALNEYAREFEAGRP